MTVDPMLIAGAVVIVITALGSLAVTIIRAWVEGKERILAAAHRQVVLNEIHSATAKADVIAIEAIEIAKKAAVTELKLDLIRDTTEKSSLNINGNLTKVQEHLTQQMKINEDLQKSVASMAEVIRSMQRTSVAPTVEGPLRKGDTRVIDRLESIDKNTSATAASIQQAARDVAGTVTSIEDTAAHTAEIEKHTAKTAAIVQDASDLKKP